MNLYLEYLDTVMEATHVPGPQTPIARMGYWTVYVRPEPSGERLRLHYVSDSGYEMDGQGPGEFAPATKADQLLMIVARRTLREDRWSALPALEPWVERARAEIEEERRREEEERERREAEYRARLERRQAWWARAEEALRLFRRRTKVRIARSDDGPTEVSAAVAGLWAIHKTLGEPHRDHRWTLTHVPTGFAVIRLPERALCAVVAERLAAIAEIPWESDDHQTFARYHEPGATIRAAIAEMKEHGFLDERWRGR